MLYIMSYISKYIAKYIIKCEGASNARDPRRPGGPPQTLEGPSRESGVEPRACLAFILLWRS